MRSGRSVFNLDGRYSHWVRFTLKEAESMARRKDEYYVPGALAEQTVVQRVADLHSGDCLGAACIVTPPEEPQDLDKSGGNRAGGDDSANAEEEEHEHANDYHETLEAQIDEQREEREAIEKALKADPDKAVWTKIYLMMDSKKIKTIQLFHEIDEDESGMIDADELRQGLFDLAGVELTDEEFERCMKTVDRDNSGEVDYRELSRAIKYGNRSAEPQ